VSQEQERERERERERVYVHKQTLWACLRNNFCNGTTNFRSLCIVADLNVAVNNINPFSVAKEKKKWTVFVLFPTCKVFHTASISLVLHVKCPRRCCLILTKFGVFRQIFLTVPSIKLHEYLSSGSQADIYRVHQKKLYTL
jgi:hypothetical protein